MPRYRYSYPTKITITWQQISEMYAFKMHKPQGENYFPKEHWKQFETLIKPILLAIPSGSERDYDPVDNVWYFAEKYYESIRDCIHALPNFELEVFEKPKPQQFVPKVPNIQAMIENYEDIVGHSISAMDYKEAKKWFLRTSMLIHPDKNKDRIEDFYRLNEAWQEIEYQHYKTKQRIGELKDVEEVTYG